MGKLFLAAAAALAVLAGACNQGGLEVPASWGAAAGNGGSTGGGTPGVVLRLPDGGLAAFLGDSGILGGILDAPRDSLVGQIICGPEARLGAPCSTGVLGCVLPSLGGACACANGTYICPLNTKDGPAACPSGAKTGARCISPLSTCIGGGANACVCGVGTYTCF